MSQCWKIPKASHRTGGRLLKPLGLQFQDAQLEELFVTHRFRDVLRRLRHAAGVAATLIPVALIAKLLLSSEPDDMIVPLSIGIVVAVLCALFAVALHWIEKYRPQNWANWRAKQWAPEAFGVALASLALLPVGLVAAEAEASLRALLIDLAVSAFYTYVPVRVKMSWPLVVSAPIACAITILMQPSSTDTSAILLVALTGLAYVARRAREFQERQTFAMTDQLPVEPDVEPPSCPEEEFIVEVKNKLEDVPKPAHSQDVPTGPCKDPKGMVHSIKIPPLPLGKSTAHCADSSDKKLDGAELDLEFEQHLQSDEWKSWAEETEDMRIQISTPRGGKGSDKVALAQQAGPSETNSKQELAPPSPQHGQDEAQSAPQDETPTTVLPDQLSAATSSPPITLCTSDNDVTSAQPENDSPSDSDVSNAVAARLLTFQNKPSEHSGDLDGIPQITPRGPATNAAAAPQPSSDTPGSKSAVPMTISLPVPVPAPESVHTQKTQSNETSGPRSILRKSGSQSQIGSSSISAEQRRVSFDAAHSQEEDVNRKRSLTDVARALRWESVEGTVLASTPETIQEHNA